MSETKLFRAGYRVRKRELKAGTRGYTAIELFIAAWFAFVAALVLGVIGVVVYRVASIPKECWSRPLVCIGREAGEARRQFEERARK